MKRITTLALCIGVMTALSGVHLYGQTDLTGLLSQLGAPPGTPTWPFPQGFVNLSNGNFHIEIPIQTLKERNGGNLTEKLIYDSSFYYLWSPDGTGQVMDFMDEYGGAGWRFVVSPSASALDSMSNVNYSATSVQCDGGSSAEEEYQDWQYIDSSGTAHNFSGIITEYTYNPGLGDDCFDVESGTGYALDGSGYYISISNYFEPIVYDQHGNEVFSYSPTTGLSTWTDTNGNTISTQDELGRTTPMFLPSGFSTSTDYIQVGIPLGEPPLFYGYAGPLPVLTNINLPNGKTYTFSYDAGGSGHTGVMTGMTLPNGGTISFQSIVPEPGGSLNPTLYHLTTPDGATSFDYSNLPTVVVTTPNGSQSTITTSYGGSWTDNCPIVPVTYPPGAITNISQSTYTGTATGTPLKSVNMQLDGFKRVTSVSTSLNGGSPQTTNYQYHCVPEPNQPDGSATNPIPSSLISSKQELDYSGNVVRETDVVYNPASQYISAHIGDLPSQVTVYGYGGYAGGSAPIAQTIYSYDGNSLFTTSGSSNTSLTGVAGYNTAFSGVTARGNLTSVSQMVSPSQFITTKTNYYNILGELVQSVDGDNNSTYYDYTDSWADSSCVSSATFAYPTTVTNAAGQTSSSTYNSCDGSVHSVKDPNSQVTSYTYDNMQRVTGISYPDGGQVTTNYGDPTNPEVITTTTLAAPDPTQVSSQTLDGLGRTSLTTAASGAHTLTAYNSMGWVDSVSNPYFTTASAYTTYTYDSLGRKLSQHQPDGSSLLWTYSGTSTTSTDENGNPTTGTADALGRLWKVIEPGSLTTIYWYDALNNLLKVNQTGNGGPDVARTRLFTYDGLSRLSTANNPETGNVSYTYDANSNVHTKTDARSVTITYAYDALNRITGKSYSDGLTPVSCYQYDSSAIANGIGRLANMWTQSATPTTCSTSATFWTQRSILGYDQMGRILREQQCTPSNCTNGTPYALSYTYDIAGNLLTSTSGVGPTPTTPIIFANTYDSGGHLISLNSNWSNNSIFPTTLFSSPTYAAFGGLTSATVGSGLALGRTYDIRSRITSETDTGSIVSAATNGSATVTITGSEQTK
jgi:YD repeat-containing protein